MLASKHGLGYYRNNGEALLKLDPLHTKTFPEDIQKAIKDIKDKYTFHPADWTSAAAKGLPEGEYIYVLRDAETGEILKVGKTSRGEIPDAIDKRISIYKNASNKTDSVVQADLYRIETDGAKAEQFQTRIPLHPFLGCLGVAPALESRGSIVPAEHGGNMDAPEASAGNTAYFPVTVRGALLYLGDGHAQMGDGEIAGTAIEVPMHARLQVDVIKGQKIAWPRFENAREIMALGAYRPLDDALRIAFTELIAWIHNETDLSELDAYQLLSQVAKVHVTEMVDPKLRRHRLDRQEVPPTPQEQQTLVIAGGNPRQHTGRRAHVCHRTRVLTSHSVVIPRQRIV